eukprot:728348-Pyramimonas_sp.AAC.1
MGNERLRRVGGPSTREHAIKRIFTPRWREQREKRHEQKAKKRAAEIVEERVPTYSLAAPDTPGGPLSESPGGRPRVTQNFNQR